MARLLPLALLLLFALLVAAPPPPVVGVPAAALGPKASLTRPGAMLAGGLGRVAPWRPPKDGVLQLSPLDCECSTTCLMSESDVQWVPTYGGGSSGGLFSGLGAWWLCNRGCYNALLETVAEPTGYRFCYIPLPDNVNDNRVFELCREPFNVQRDPLTGFWIRYGC